MKKEELLKAYLELSPEDQQEFLTLAYESTPIPTELPLIYEGEDGEKQVFAAIIPSRRHEITGIVSGGKIVNLCEESKMNWNFAKKAAARRGLTILSKEDVPELSAEMKKFNEVVELLKKHGVKADKWMSSCLYHCAEKSDDASAFVARIDTGELYTQKSNTSYFIYTRFVRALV